MAHMYVANHISWLDVIIINAIVPSAFIAKDDVRSWPLIGWLSEKTDTYFMQRGSRQAAHRAVSHISELLRTGIDVVVFPEGTTTKGDQVLPFHGALLQGAIDANTPVQPIVIFYHDKYGNQSTITAYYADMGLMESIWRVLAADYTAATIYLLPALDSSAFDRRTLATALRADIVTHLTKIGVCKDVDA